MVKTDYSKTTPIPDYILYHPRLNANHVRVIGIIINLAGGTGSCEVSGRRIAQLSHLSRQTAVNAIGWLSHLKLIEVSSKRRHRRGKVYTVTTGKWDSYDGVISSTQTLVLSVLIAHANDNNNVAGLSINDMRGFCPGMSVDGVRWAIDALEGMKLISIIKEPFSVNQYRLYPGGK